MERLVQILICFHFLCAHGFVIVKSVTFFYSVNWKCIIRFTEFGGPMHHRPVQDLAFGVARFIQKGGSFVNYYMVCTL